MTVEYVLSLLPINDEGVIQRRAILKVSGQPAEVLNGLLAEAERITTDNGCSIADWQMPVAYEATQVHQQLIELSTPSTGFRFRLNFGDEEKAHIQLKTTSVKSMDAEGERFCTTDACEVRR